MSQNEYTAVIYSAANATAHKLLFFAPLLVYDISQPHADESLLCAASGPCSM